LSVAQSLTNHQSLITPVASDVLAAPKPSLAVALRKGGSREGGTSDSDLFPQGVSKGEGEGEGDGDSVGAADGDGEAAGDAAGDGDASVVAAFFLAAGDGDASAVVVFFLVAVVVDSALVVADFLVVDVAVVGVVVSFFAAQETKNAMLQRSVIVERRDFFIDMCRCG
jgi:hypothetical protein